MAGLPFTRVISRRSYAWLLAFALLTTGLCLRARWENAACMEAAHHNGYQAAVSQLHEDGDAVSFRADLLCQPGELEPWWMKAVLLGFLAALVGSTVHVIRDMRTHFLANGDPDEMV